MRISQDFRSLPPGDPSAAPPPPRRHRAAGLIVGALVLMAAFVLAAPYLSSALKAGQSLISGESTGGFPSANYSGSATGVGTCSSAVSIGNLVAPDIGSDGSASVAYPSDYCALAAYALQLINADRAANGTGPVDLGYNRAAQQHADSLLYYGYFSHIDTQGFKPYMRYTLLGGRGGDFENVATSSGLFASTSAVEGGIRQLEELMVHNDTACCNNGHRYNILNSLHNVVSIGVAYNNNVVYFDEEFENEYMNLNFAAAPSTAANPYYVTMEGTVTHQVTSPTAIYIAYDPTPSAETPAQLNGGPREYTPGTLLGGVLPPNGFFGGCGQFTSGTTVCADRWQFDGSTVDISFSLAQFVKGSGPGVYTVYLVTGSDTNSAITTISIFVT